MTAKKFWLFLLCTLCVLVLFYWVIGYSLISNPGFLLERSANHETIARQIFSCEGLEFDPPKIYLLPKHILKFFFPPYHYLHKQLGLEQTNASFIDVQNGVMVLQEDVTTSDYFHELGHFVDYSLNPDGYAAKGFKDKEFFAAEFALRMRKKCGH